VRAAIDDGSIGAMADDPLLERIEAALVGGPPEPAGRIVIADHDPEWAPRFNEHETRIRAALGEAAVAVEHIGSTSVPGLAAKPIIDILLVVERSADESTYVPQLEAAGYELRAREPDFHEHRLLRPVERGANVHVLSVGSPEIDRYLLFRDRLRAHPDERARYEATKRRLAAQDWPTVDHYADAKTEIVEAIIAGAREAAD
jgi:GrpB-like predicted nucleotidyltransferase (UPF0157 family)